MAGLLIAILFSWGLLWLFDKSSLEKLGLIPSRQRLILFFVGLIISFVCSLIYFFSSAYLSKSSLAINNNFNIQTFFSGLWWTSKAVLFEEFLFRGALLYLAIKYLGAKTACILSAIAFGIYHWFSYGIFGNAVQMIWIFILTATVGLLFAFCFVKTKSMYLQIGLHLGWNFITIVIFSKGPLGQQFLIVTKGQQIGALITIILFLYQIACLPILTIYYLNSSSKLASKKNNS